MLCLYCYFTTKKTWKGETKMTEKLKGIKEINVMVIDGDYDNWGINKQRQYLSNCLDRAKQENVRIIITLGNTFDPASQPTIRILAGLMRAKDGIIAIPLDRGLNNKASMNEVIGYLTKSDFAVDKFIICSDKTLLTQHFINASEIVTMVKEVAGFGFGENDLAA